MKKIKEKVRIMLRDNPATRDSDALLAIEFWKQYFYIDTFLTHNQINRLLEIIQYAPESMIGRYRQQIQYDEGLYPASPEVEAERKKNIPKVLDSLGYGVKAPEIRRDASIMDKSYQKTLIN
jgi:hypothetical protein